MEPTEALEGIEPAPDHFHRRIAVLIATMASIVALATMFGDNAMENQIVLEAKSVDAWARYTGSLTHANDNRNAAVVIRNLAPALPPADRSKAEGAARSLVRGAATIFEPRSRLARSQAQQLEKQAQAYGSRGDIFDYAAIAATLGVILASLTLVTEVRRLVLFSLAMGTVAVVLTIDALLDAVRLPAIF